MLATLVPFLIAATGPFLMDFEADELLFLDVVDALNDSLCDERCSIAWRTT
jgi:hypothetical protein